MSDKKKERKAGAAAPPTWMQSAAKVGIGKTASASGKMAAGQLGAMAKTGSIISTKLGIAITMSAGFAVGIHGLYDMNQRGGFGVPRMAPQKVSAFDSRGEAKYDAGQVAGLPGTAAPAQSALDLARSANKGKDAPKGSEQAVDEGEGVEDDEDFPDVPEADGNADAMAMAEEMMGGAMDGAAGGRPELARKFGKLSTSMGGKSRLAGGVGLSGGIGGKFKQKAFKSRLGNTSGMKSARKAQISRSMQAARGSSAMRGRNARRLDRMARRMHSGRRNSLTSQADMHTQEWSTSQTSDNAITGGEDGGEIGVEGGEFEGEGTEQGGPVNKDYGSKSLPDVEDHDVGDEENVTPWQEQVDTATLMINIASILLLVAFIIGLCAKGAGPYAAILYKIAKWIAYAAMACAAIATMMGLMIMMQGQMLQGGIFTLVGGLLTWLSKVAAEGYDKAADAASAAEKAAKPAVEEAGKQLATKGAGAAAGGGSGAGAGAGGGGAGAGAGGGTGAGAGAGGTGAGAGAGGTGAGAGAGGAGAGGAGAGGAGAGGAGAGGAGAGAGAGGAGAAAGAGGAGAAAGAGGAAAGAGAGGAAAAAGAGGAAAAAGAGGAAAAAGAGGAAAGAAAAAGAGGAAAGAAAAAGAGAGAGAGAAGAGVGGAAGWAAGGAGALAGAPLGGAAAGFVGGNYADGLGDDGSDDSGDGDDGPSTPPPDSDQGQTKDEHKQDNDGGDQDDTFEIGV